MRMMVVCGQCKWCCLSLCVHTGAVFDQKIKHHQLH